MDEKMDVKERLIHYPALHSEVVSLCRRLDDLEQMEIIANRAELDDIERQITANLAEMEQLRVLIGSLSDPREREVLMLRYVDGANGKPVKWKDVAKKLVGGVAEKHLVAARRLHNSALEHLPDYTEMPL